MSRELADIIVDNGPVPLVTTAITAYYAFHAETTTYNTDDVYEGIYQIGQPHLIVNITDDPSKAGEPQIGLMFSWVPVTGWTAANDIYEFDAFPFFPFTYGDI